MSDPTIPHVPVLLAEVIDGLMPHDGGVYVDGTLGLGGHAEAILKASSPTGKLIGFDRDREAIQRASERLSRFGERFYAVHDSYAQLAQVTPSLGIVEVDGILLDLGLSSLQLDDPKRGFAFRYDAPLDMRFDTTSGQTAADLVNELPEQHLADLIFEFGEERHSRRIARAIVRARPITNTTQLAEIAKASIPGAGREKIHPATRLFQALRIAVNSELDELTAVLPQTLSLLKSGGRLAVISFHSLEDRQVKQWMKREATDCLCPPEQLVCTCGHVAALTLVTRKPIEAGEDEIAANPRARSAKLRIAEKL